LNEGDLAGMTSDQTARWVVDAAVEGAPAVRTGVWRNNCTVRAAKNVKAFRQTATRVQMHLQAGCPRRQLARRMTMIVHRG
jgi:hypothetical protein